MGSRERNETARRKEAPRKQRKMIVHLALLIMIFFGLTSAANRWKGELQVERFDTRGHRFLLEREVVALSNVPLGTPLYEVDLTKVRERLMVHPYVRDAVVAHDLPSTIKITIQERTPVAIVVGSELLSVDEEGYILPHVNSPALFDLPVLTGLVQQRQIRVGLKCESEEVLVALQILHESLSFDSELYHSISEINLAGVDPVAYTAEHGIPILFGKERVLKQLACLQSFWNQYVHQQGSEKVASIDLRFENEVVVRWNSKREEKKSG